jgi:hypothetical protein
MATDASDRVRVDPEGNEVTGDGMAEIVEPDTGQLGSRDQREEVADHEISDVQGLAVRLTKDEVQLERIVFVAEQCSVLRSLSLEPAEFLDYGGEERDGANPVL